MERHVNTKDYHTTAPSRMSTFHWQISSIHWLSFTKYVSLHNDKVYCIKHQWPDMSNN